MAMNKHGGFDEAEFQRDLKRLKVAQLKLAPEALDRALHVLADEIERQAPRDTGALAASVEVTKAKVSKDHVSQRVIVAGGHDPRWFVGFIEYGARGIAPNPFVRRSLAAKLPEMIRIIESGMDPEKGD